MTDSSRPDDPESDEPEVESGRYTMAEAARVKRVSYHTVSRAVRNGKLVATRLGRMALIDADHLRAWHPMRERAPRKYRRETDRQPSPITRPALAKSADTAHVSDRLATAIATLHEGAANRTIAGFGDWLASLTASLLALETVVIWQLDDASGHFHSFGRFGIEASTVPSMVSGSAAEAMLHLIERDDVQRLDPILTDQIAGSWIPPTTAREVISVPCRQGLRTLGLMIGVAGSRRNALSDEDIRFAQRFAPQATIAIEHLELRRSTRQTLVSSPALFDDLPLQVMAIDRLGQLVYVNQELVRQWGESIREKYVGRHYAHFVGMFRRERLDGTLVRIQDHPFTRALRGEHVHEEPYLVPSFFGAPRIFSLSARPLHDEHGVLSGAVLVSRDVTAERQTADGELTSLRMLAEARRKVDLLGALSSEIGHRENADDVFDIVARRMCEALNADSTAVMTPAAEGHMIVRAVHQLSGNTLEVGRELDRLEVPASVLALTQREMFVVTNEDAGPSGRVLLAESNAKAAVMIPLLNGDDALGVVNVLFADPMQPQPVDRDFAMALGRQFGHAIHLRNAVVEVEATRRRLSSVLDQVPQAIVILDASNGNIVVMNREALSLWGDDIRQRAPRGSDIVMLDGDGHPIKGDRRHPFMRPIQTEETLLAAPMTTVDASGAIVDVLVNVAPIYGHSGELRGVVAVLQRREHFESMDRGKDEFISVVAHELRNPLTSLRGNLQLLERRLGRIADETVEQEVSRIGSVIEQVDRIGDLVGRMLDISRADLGTLTIDPAECDAVALATGAIREIQGQSAGRTITLEAPGSVPGVWDRVRVQQILINLLTNALRYAPDGDIDVAVAEHDGDRVTISVRDYGPGVPAPLRRKLFRLYYRFDDDEGSEDVSAGQQRGLGIGLYISARLANAHGGDLRVEDAEGGGAIFTLTLPREAG